MTASTRRDERRNEQML